MDVGANGYRTKGDAMEMHQLQQFAAIAESASMHEAAERLYLSQSTLSYNLKKLERELDCRLFDRTRSGLKLTAYGEILLRHVRRIADDLDQLNSEIVEERRRDSQRIHLGCFSLLFASFEMSQIAAELPDCMFEACVAGEVELAEGLAEGRFDALISAEPLPGLEYRSRPLYCEQAFLSVPKGSELAGVDLVGLDDLAGLQFSIEGDLSGCSEWYRRILGEAKVPAQQVDITPFREHLKVKDALPTCNLITSFIMEYVRVNEVRAVIPIDADVARREVRLIWRRDAENKLAPLLEYLDESLERLLSGNTFIPYFLFPEDAENLIMRA